MSALRNETVLSVHHWTDELFSFRTTRDKGFRFACGQFAMIGLQVEGKPVLRAYSIASPNYHDELEFFSIKVPDGRLTSRLRHLEPGDPILIGNKATGTLLLDSLLAGRNLYLLGTGTGLAPFLSVVQDPEVYERFEKVVLVHGCRFVRDLAYRTWIGETLPANEVLGETIQRQLVYYPTVTREPFGIAAASRTSSRAGRWRATSACRRSTSRMTASCSAVASRCWPISAPCSRRAASRKAASPARPSSSSKRPSSSSRPSPILHCDGGRTRWTRHDDNTGPPLGG